MKKRSNKFIFLVFLLAFSGFFSLNPGKIFAASYDIYVDKSYDGEEEGNSEKPYKTIEKAISESASRGKKIYVRNGEYKETIKLSKGVEIYGQSKNNTIIQGEGLAPVTLEDSNVLENVTVSGGYTAITVQGKVRIKNCIVTKATKNAIILAESSSQATVEKSELFGNGKGIYVQIKRNVSIVGNYIHGNGEEGVDIRQKVQGTVSGNDIVGNGEGGIELVIGSSKLNITNNKIQKNKACGVANQFYSDWDRVGKITLSKNTISRNGKYGICCLAPSGGEGLKKGYWNESLNISENRIDDNNMKAISGSCKIIEAVSEEEEKKNEVIESPEAEKNSENENDSQKNNGSGDEETPIAQENEKNFTSLISQVRLEKNVLDSLIYEQKQNLGKENRIKTFFFGRDRKKITLLRENNEKTKEKITFVQEALERVDSDDLVLEGQKLIDDINAKFYETENFALNQEKSFNLFGWLTKYLKF
jgi:parallel beta-helix repeat protein